jgi:2-oxoglutarate dehydrogenase E2 component (dihydrolipoamide succinyltransferase)
MAMATNVDVPGMRDSITEAVLLEWLKADGDHVEDGESICVLETDKANVELPAPGAGVLHRLKQEGETVRIGESIARLEAPAAESPPQERPSRPPAAPPAEARTPS